MTGLFPTTENESYTVTAGLRLEPNSHIGPLTETTVTQPARFKQKNYGTNTWPAQHL